MYCLYKKKGLNFTLLITLILYFVGYLINVYTPIWESIPGVSFFFGFFTKTLSTARNGIFFGPMFIAIGLLLSRTRRLPKKVSLIGFLISFVLFFAEVSLYRCDFWICPGISLTGGSWADGRRSYLFCGRLSDVSQW